MHALVTGANGHLGSNIVRALLVRGDRVRAGVRSVADADKCAALRALGGVELVDADLGKPAQLRAAMDGIDTLFHVAAVYSTVESEREAEILRTAIEGTEASLRAARDAGVRRNDLAAPDRASVAALRRAEPPRLRHPSDRHARGGR